MDSQELLDFVQFTHKYSPLCTMVKDPNCGHYGKFWILDSNENINGKYLDVIELYEFWKSNPNWVKEIAEPRLGKR